MKLILKHSNRCPISFAAKKEVEAFLSQYPDQLEVEWVDVINNRQRSEEISQIFRVPHESPQVILFDQERSILWQASHHSITKDHLIKYVIEKSKKS